jgi:hypothetical protein
MVERKLLSVEEIRALLEPIEEIGFDGKNRKEIYEWVRQTPVEQQYHVQGKLARGVLRSYIAKMTGLSPAQTTRLIGQYLCINERVSRLLGKLLAEQTKSRPRRSNGNGLVESKNGSADRVQSGSNSKLTHQSSRGTDGKSCSFVLMYHEAESTSIFPYTYKSVMAHTDPI